MIPKTVKGVISARADVDTKTAVVEHDSGEAGVGEMNKAVEIMGYRLKEV